MFIESYINSPVPSLTYLIIEDGHALLIDPGSKDSSKIIDRIEKLKLQLDYIILTHEHFDHVWGVNSIKSKFGCKIISSTTCSQKLRIPQNYFNLLYFEDPSPYNIDNIDIEVSDAEAINWKGHEIRFIMTPGHSSSSMCISIDNCLFSGDAIMKNYKPVILKRHEGSWAQYRSSVRKIIESFTPETQVYPGHGSSFDLGSAKEELLSQ